MAICCQSMALLIEDMGKRGFSAIVKGHEDLLFFSLQFRTVEPSVEEAIRRGDIRIPPGAGKIRLNEEMTLKYCPSCGTDLGAWVAKNKAAACELFERSRPFAL